MKNDILTRIVLGEISVSEGEKTLDAVLESDDAPMVARILNFSEQEWTAFGHGVELEELAMWRNSGWPQPCPICKRTVEVRDFGWMARGHGGIHRLYHLDCLDSVIGDQTKSK